MNNEESVLASRKPIFNRKEANLMYHAPWGLLQAIEGAVETTDKVRMIWILKTCRLRTINSF
jgi:hypothetical protein